MPPLIVGVDEVVVVLPISRPRVVGRINVDDIDLPGVAVQEELKGVEVVGVNDGMVRPVRCAGEGIDRR